MSRPLFCSTPFRHWPLLLKAVSLANHSRRNRVGVPACTSPPPVALQAPMQMPRMGPSNRHCEKELHRVSPISPRVCWLNLFFTYQPLRVRHLDGREFPGPAPFESFYRMTSVAQLRNKIK